jgi:acyl-CoA thioesterase
VGEIRPDIPIDHGDFTQRLCCETLAMSERLREMALEVGDMPPSMAGRAHGGVLFTLLETVMGRAVISRLPEEKGCATLEAKIEDFRPVQSGRIVARATVPRTTRRSASAEGAIVDGAGNGLARSSGTFMITESLVQAERERI